MEARIIGNAPIGGGNFSQVLIADLEEERFSLSKCPADLCRADTKKVADNASNAIISRRVTPWTIWGGIPVAAATSNRPASSR